MRQDKIILECGIYVYNVSASFGVRFFKGIDFKDRIQSDEQYQCMGGISIDSAGSCGMNESRKLDTWYCNLKYEYILLRKIL